MTYNNILIGINGDLAETYKLIQLSANHEASVLITGETGTGKNIVAKAIHYYRTNSNSTFVGINCAALPENLIESELFGLEKGAFTGALSTKKGLFDLQMMDNNNSQTAQILEISRSTLLSKLKAYQNS